MLSELARLRWTIAQSLRGEQLCIQAHTLRHQSSHRTPRFRGPPRSIMSGRTRCAVTFVHSPGGIGASLWYQSPHLPFPNGTCGFLYYRSDRESPLAGTIRFRVTPDHSPASFPHGKDLLVPSKSSSARSSSTSTSQPTQLALSRQIFGARRSFDSHLTLFAIDQPFPVDFARIVCHIVVGPDELHLLRLDTRCVRTHPTPDSELTPCHAAPGAGLARFERSTLREHTGQCMLLLRIVKITEPVVPATRYPGRLVSPAQGQLVSVHDQCGRAEPWAYNVERDTANGAALRLLWDM
ncbi:hypothetical protein B0H10DRAFT_2437240 [Mycena sp. CBHHK59/15]|nr:hypothetical protein B0H10DRAFT_2437240 [Mycena sp. CBHHK59/15]